MVFLVQCSHTERMNSTVQSNPRELDQTSVWFQSEHLAFSPVQFRHKPSNCTANQSNNSQLQSKSPVFPLASLPPLSLQILFFPASFLPSPRGRDPLLLSLFCALSATFLQPFVLSLKKRLCTVVGIVDKTWPMGGKEKKKELSGSSSKGKNVQGVKTKQPTLYRNEKWQAIQAPAIADPSRDCVGKHVSVPGSFWNDSSSVERMRNYDCVVLRSAFCEPCCYDHHGASS